MKTYLWMAVVGMTLAQAPAVRADASGAVRDLDVVTGQTEALINYCTEAVPKHALQYKYFMTRLVSFGEGDREVNMADRNSKNYQLAYEETHERLEKLPEKEAAQFCSAITGVKE